MPCYQTVVLRAGDHLPRVLKVTLPERSSHLAEWASAGGVLYNGLRDAERFERSWFADFRVRWQRDLYLRRFFQFWQPDMEDVRVP